MSPRAFTITLALLVDLDACYDHANAFASAFPDGLTLDSPEPDEGMVDRIVAAELDVGWFAQRVLTDAAQAEHDRAAAAAEAEYERVRAPAQAEYERATAPAWAEYERATAAAWAEYEQVRVRDAAWVEYERATAPAWTEYERATAAAWAEYQRTTVRCLWKLLTKPENRRLP